MLEHPLALVRETQWVGLSETVQEPVLVHLSAPALEILLGIWSVPALARQSVRLSESVLVRVLVTLLVLWSEIRSEVCSASSLATVKEHLWVNQLGTETVLLSGTLLVTEWELLLGTLLARQWADR
jgi:hypothetical protein